MMRGLFLSGAARNMAQANIASANASEAARRTAEVRTQSEAIQGDVERLFMITEALWTILKKEHGYSDEDLGLLIQEIDLRDGKLDGKVSKQQNPTCPECNRTLIGRHQMCLYCGAAVARDPFQR